MIHVLNNYILTFEIILLLFSSKAVSSGTEEHVSDQVPVKLTSEKVCFC